MFIFQIEQFNIFLNILREENAENPEYETGTELAFSKTRVIFARREY